MELMEGPFLIPRCDIMLYGMLEGKHGNMDSSEGLKYALKSTGFPYKETASNKMKW